MSNSIDAHLLKKRDFHLNQETMCSVAGVWYQDKQLTTQLLNSYTLLIPDGESFIIRTCKQYAKQVEPRRLSENRAIYCGKAILVKFSDYFR